MNFTLKKDLPHIKAGAIFEPMEDILNNKVIIYIHSVEAYMGDVKMKRKIQVFDKEVVENNPEWFEPTEQNNLFRITLKSYDQGLRDMALKISDTLAIDTLQFATDKSFGEKFQTFFNENINPEIPNL